DNRPILQQTIFDSQQAQQLTRDDSDRKQINNNDTEMFTSEVLPLGLKEFSELDNLSLIQLSVSLKLQDFNLILLQVIKDTIIK
ncbi:30422_t:CDS:2, partial [Racocetra persica]